MSYISQIPCFRPFNVFALAGLVKKAASKGGGAGAPATAAGGNKGGSSNPAPVGGKGASKPAGSGGISNKVPGSSSISSSKGTSSFFSPRVLNRGNGRSSWSTGTAFSPLPLFGRPSPFQTTSQRFFVNPAFDANTWAMQGSDPNQLDTLQQVYTDVCGANFTHGANPDPTSFSSIGMAYGVLFGAQNSSAITGVHANFTQCIQDNSDAAWKTNGPLWGAITASVMVGIGVSWLCCRRNQRGTYV